MTFPQSLASLLREARRLSWVTLWTAKSTMESVVATQVFMSTSVNANAPVEAAFIPGRSADASSHPIHHPPTTRG